MITIPEDAKKLDWNHINYMRQDLKILTDLKHEDLKQTHQDTNTPREYVNMAIRKAGGEFYKVHVPKLRYTVVIPK